MVISLHEQLHSIWWDSIWWLHLWAQCLLRVCSTVYSHRPHHIQTERFQRGPVLPNNTAQICLWFLSNYLHPQHDNPRLFHKGQDTKINRSCSVCANMARPRMANTYPEWQSLVDHTCCCHSSLVGNNINIHWSANHCSYCKQTWKQVKERLWLPSRFICCRHPDCHMLCPWPSLLRGSHCPFCQSC